MTPKTSLVTVVAVALVAVPAAWGKGQAITAPPDVFERAVAAQHRSTAIVSPDAVDRAVAARLASQSASQPNPRAMLASDSVHSALAANAATLTSPDSVTSNGSGRELEWPQIGIGFGVGILLALGLFLAMRYTRIRTLAH
ncbi:MAG: hypothetical protein M3Q67_07265 [Actinomycetota bacterium]|nr:hypothetical protein [Actinomycetota bacterium]MDQ3086581.1 hypothetical protein [Actinomycetota bacterium]MDQ3425138.1 hypothetical protein [Actinomycetota bacterium]